MPYPINIKMLPILNRLMYEIVLPIPAMRKNKIYKTNDVLYDCAQFFDSIIFEIYYEVFKLLGTISPSPTPMN